MKHLLLTLGLLMSHSLLAEEVLYIGDSHSHIRAKSPEENLKRFGNIFVEGMALKGYSVSYYAACGSSAISWVNGSSTHCGYTVFTASEFTSVTKSAFPGLRDIYLPQKHSKIVINLGDNMFEWKTVLNKKTAVLAPGALARGLRSFLALLPDVTPEQCSWIGPTYHIEGRDYLKSDLVVDEFYRQLEDSLAQKCRVIDSRPMVQTKDPNDGLHHVNSDSQAWAQAVLAFF